jgi:hypothetical protein
LEETVLLIEEIVIKQAALVASATSWKIASLDWYGTTSNGQQGHDSIR